MNYKIKKEWITDAGLPAVVVLAAPTFPHFCGYIGVTKEHKLYGLEHNSVIASVHGGLTYSASTEIIKKSAYPTSTMEPTWWFGFDAAHSGDLVDWKTGKELLVDMSEIEINSIERVKEIINERPIMGDTIKDIDYMVMECERLAIQLQDT